MSHDAEIFPHADRRASAAPAVIVPAIPVARCPVTVRVATASDCGFIDGLQKMHTHMVGWMPTKQIEGKIALGQVVIAEDPHKTPVGYCIAHDQYAGRDDVGIPKKERCRGRRTTRSP